MVALCDYKRETRISNWSIIRRRISLLIRKDHLHSGSLGSTTNTGRYSYKYIEDSIRHGKLVNLESHRVGPSAHRPVGATYIPTRGKKILYSLQDDQVLWDWVQQYEGVPGYPISGNKIYQDLAASVSVIPSSLDGINRGIEP